MRFFPLFVALVLILGFGAGSVQLAQSDPRSERGAERLARMEEKQQAEENTALHLELLNLDITLPAAEGWSVRTEKETQNAYDRLTRPLPDQGPYSLADKELDIRLRYVEYKWGGDCTRWQETYEKIIQENQTLQGLMKVTAAGGWLPETWHRGVVENSGGVQACRLVTGGVLEALIKGRTGDEASVTRALTAIDGQIDRFNAAVMERPVPLEVLQVSFKNPPGSLWATQKSPMGGDMIVRVVPARPEITMMVGGNASPPAKCAAIIEQNGGAPGNRLEDGARFVPASWHQQVARAENGAIMACKDVPVGLLSAMIGSKDEVADADFASARAVLESITAAVEAAIPKR